VRRRAKDLLEDVVAEALESLGFNVRVDLRVQGRAGEVEVDVWGEKLVGDTRFAVYASCKNWDNPVDVGTVREEFGRVLQMMLIPHARILVAPYFTDPARREAVADGFMVVEVGEKAHDGNVDKIYSRVYYKLDRLFTGVAPRRLQELAEKVRELAERARRIAEEARRSAEEIEGIKAELERMAVTTRPPELPAPTPSTPPQQPPTPPSTSQPKPPGAPGSVLDEMFDRLGVPDDLRVRAKRLLLHAYTTCYVLYEDRVYANRFEQEVVGDEVAYRVLSQLGLLGLYRNSRRRWDEVIFKSEDVIANVVASLAREHVESVRGDLRRLVEEYGWEVALMACLKKGISSAFEKFEPEFLKPEDIPLPVKVTVAVGAVKPLLKERYLKFWEELRKLDLAFRCREWLILLPEARNVIMEIIKDKVEEFSRRENVVRRLATLNVFYSYFLSLEGKELVFKSLMNELGLRLEDLAEVAESLYRRGLVSRFTTTPPYMVVYDVNAFRKAVAEEIESLYSQAGRP
jgi:hypothetical protein